uniref:Guanylate cyclase soluble subunit alpha-3 n=1 Tax=Lygus hesperus TaxID=30085 RepID=A0A0A9YZF1_LYGHE
MGCTAPQLFDMKEHTLEDDDGITHTIYTATCKLMLPEPHRLYVAEGTGRSVKDAELLAAMHAEMVCDSLGVPLFRLPSMQIKHATGVRARGRYAPMPEDPIAPEGTAVPPPLRMLPRLFHTPQGNHNHRQRRSHNTSANGGNGNGGETCTTTANSSKELVHGTEDEVGGCQTSRIRTLHSCP